MTLRKMVVVRAPSTTNCPMVRIANRTLQLHGFVIGAVIEVAYEQNIITLRILDHANKLQKPSSPVALSTASSEAGAGEGDEYAGRRKPDTADVTKAVSAQSQPMRFVLSGHWSNVSA